MSTLIKERRISLFVNLDYLGLHHFAVFADTIFVHLELIRVVCNT